MENFNELLIKRRSIRKFTGEKLTSDETALILQAALLAPTSKNSHSWEFIVVEDKEMLTKLSQCKPTSNPFISKAALAVIVIGNPLKSDVWIEDASIASILMQLQAEDMGIGSCWIQVFQRNYSGEVTSSEYINQLLNIPMPFEVLSILAFGRKEKALPPQNTDELLWEKVHIGSFKSK